MSRYQTVNDLSLIHIYFDGSEIEKGEVIAWNKDKYNLFRQQVRDSFVADCAMAVLKALENCISKEKFIEKMKQFGWSVNWTEKRKHIKIGRAHV